MIRKISALLMGFVVVVFSSCTALNDFTTELKNWRVDTEQMRKEATALAQNVNGLANKVTELDANKDGWVDLKELLIGLGGLGALFVVRNMRSDRVKSELEKKIEIALDRLPPAHPV